MAPSTADSSAQPTVSVWLVQLDGAGSALATQDRLLGAEERARAGRLRFDRDRRRFIARRVALRLVLAAELGLAPERIVYRAGEWGKPQLAVDEPTSLRSIIACRQATSPRSLWMGTVHHEHRPGG